MSESDLLRPKETFISSRASGNSFVAGADDEVALKPMEYLEPTTFISTAMFEHAPITVMMVDQTGRIRHMNTATVELFGYSKEELVGEPIEILVSSGVRPHHEQLRKSFMARPTARPMAEGRRLTARKKDDTEVSVDIALNPIFLEASETAVILSITDAAPRERAELAELFVKEVTHRARNMFAIIGAISRQLSKHTTTVPEFQTALESRLNSL